MKEGNIQKKENVFLTTTPEAAATDHSLSHQLPLDGEDSLSGGFTVALLAGDDDHLRVAVLHRQVDLGVGLFADLVASNNLLFSPFSIMSQLFWKRLKSRFQQ